MATWGNSLINYDHLSDSADLLKLLEAIQDLQRLAELVMIGMEHDEPATDDPALLHSILWPIGSAAHRAAKLERERRATPSSDPVTPAPLHVLREEGA